MESTRAPPAEPTEGGQRILLSDEDVVSHLVRGQAVQNDVQKALASLASALSSVSDHEGIIRSVKRRFDEREEARAHLSRAIEEARAEKQSRAKIDHAQSESQTALRDEVGRLERAVRVAEDTCTSAQREAEQAASAAQKDIASLQERADAAVKDAADWQQKASAGQSRLESTAAEVSALHEAMAGLHGEMGAVQRELDGAKASQDKLIADLSKAEGRHRKSQEAGSIALERAKDAEKRHKKEAAERERVSAELAKLLQASEDEKREQTALHAEIKRLKESEAAYCTKTEKLNTTNRELNALLQRLSTDLEEAKSAGESSSKRADTSAIEVGVREEELRRIREALATTESRVASLDRDKGLLKDQQSKLAAEVHARAAEADRQRGEMDLLEREKHDLILDVQERVRTQQEATSAAERFQERAAQLEQKLKDGESAKLAAEISKNKVQDELNDARRGSAMQDERIEGLRSELSTLQRTLEQTTEAAKSRDKENAQRLVQLSQANAKLSGESANSRARVASAEDTAEKAGQGLQDARKALAKSEEDGLRAAESVQRLEEELEVADARWKAAQGQLIAAARREKRSTEEAEKKLQVALELRQKEMDAALSEAETNAQRRSMEAEASHRAAVRKHERLLTAVQDEAKKQLSEEGAKRAREVSDARRKSNAVFEALQTLQGELRNSEAKGSGLERQVSQLSARMNRAGSSSVAAAGSSEGDGNSLGSTSGVKYERDKNDGNARGAEVTEAEISALRRQMKAATEAKEAAQRSALEERLRAEDETKKRSSLEDSLSRKESEMLVALERLNTIKKRQKEAEDGARDAEEDLRSLVRQRESEIESLTRRNQVLNDALSRLTSVDAYATETGTMGSLSAVSTKTAGEGGNGFPIPRLIDRGRELAASLGDSWQTASDSSFSSTFGGGAGNPPMELEASTSIFADGSSGFEPPAPPCAEFPHGRHSQHHNRNQGKQPLGGTNSHDDPYYGRREGTSNNNQIGSSMGGSRDDRHDRTRPGDFPMNNRQGGGGQGAGSDDSMQRRFETRISARDNGTAATRAGAKNRAPMVGTTESNSSKRGAEVLHGVSAALASGALPTPVATRLHPDAKTTEFECPGDGDAESLDPLPPLPSNNDKNVDGLRGELRHKAPTGGSASSALIREGGSRISADMRISDDGDASHHRATQGLAGYQRTDDGGAQTRQQIDQALQERALRRRNSDGEVLGIPRQDPHSRRATSGNTNSTATTVNLAFRSSLQSEFRPNAGSTILGASEEGARFINLGATAQRAAGGGLRQGQPGRRVGGAVTRARSAVVGPNGASLTTPKKSSAARIYGMPQNSR